MRIVFFSHYFPPEVNAPAVRTYEHVVRWQKEGHQVTVVTCAPNCPTGIVQTGYRNRFPFSCDNVDGIEVYRVWTSISANKGFLKRSINYTSYMIMALLVGWFLKRPNVIICTSPQFFCGWAGLLCGKLRVRRIPVILEIRDIWPASIKAVRAVKSEIFYGCLSWLEKKLYQWSDRIVAVGEGYQHHILQALGKGRADKVTVITNGVDLDNFQPMPADTSFLRKYDCEGKFICSYVGTIGMAHGLEVIVRAAKRFKAAGRDDIRFLVVGDGAERQDLESLSRRENVTRYVRFTGLLPKDQMPRVIASSNALLVHLRESELFESVIPSKIFETMAMQRPIILGVKGEVRDIVEEAGAGKYMTPESDEELARIITAWADDPKTLEKFGKSARSFVAERYNRNTLADRFLDLICKVSGEPSLHVVAVGREVSTQTVDVVSIE